MSKIYNAIDVAKYMIDKCTREDRPISNLQLQKILYFLQGESYKECREPLFSNRIEAWPYGPVVPDVYYRYSAGGGVPICMFYEDADAAIEPQDREWLNPLIEHYGGMDVWDLVDLSHTEGAPWDRTMKAKGGGTIPEEWISCYSWDIVRQSSINEEAQK